MNGKLLFLFLLLPYCSNAQTQKGAWMINVDGIAFQYEFPDFEVFYAIVQKPSRTKDFAEVFLS